MHGGLFRGDPAGVDQSLHEGVVGADLGQLAVPQQVDAGVADVRDRDVVADPEDGADGRAHPHQLRMLEDGLGEEVCSRR